MSHLYRPPLLQLCEPSFSGPPRGWEGPRANTRSGAHNKGGSGGTPPENFEVLHALKRVLGASEAPFCACIQYIYLQVAVFV